MIPTMFGAITIVFFAIHMAPGDPISLFLPPQIPGGANTELADELRAQYGFDKPLYRQYTTYVGQMVRLDFGQSLRQRTSVRDDLQRRVFNTLQLGIAALIFSTIVGGTLGTISAIHHGSWIDRATMIFVMLGISLPSFWIAMMLILALGLHWQVLPPSGFGGPLYTLEGLRMAILPVLTLGIAGSGSLARYTRAALLEVLQKDYVRTARAKGLKERAVIRRHALRNALLPILTILGLSFGEILGGAVVVETVFSWPGIGRYLIAGVNGRDFPVVQASVLVIAIGFMLAILLTDVLLALADPRIRFD